jgi:hypothetical protein
MEAGFVSFAQGILGARGDPNLSLQMKTSHRTSFSGGNGMRVFAAVLLGMSLVASPLLARNAGETGKEDTPAAATSTPSVPDKPTAVKPEASAIESEMQDLRSLVEEQRAELESQRAALKAQQLKMEALEEKFGAAPSESAVTPVAGPAASSAITSTAISSATPAPVAGAPIGTPSTTKMAAMSAQGGEKESPLYFKIGGAEFYPLGFMDLTNFFRTSDTGTGIGTSFNSVPFSNTALGRLSEDHFSAQNSRIGLRTHAMFGAADVTGYLEADFLGFSVPNLYDTSNADTLRMRLYWVDVKSGIWEVLGGQSWSLLTPNRNGLSALPGDLFYSQDMDTNYQLGLTWARQAGVRVIVHPTKSWAVGVSLENPEQTLPGGVVLPTTVSANDGSQFDTNSGSLTGSGVASNTAVPNLHPDIIAKTAFDFGPQGHHVHFDFAGLFRSFKGVNLVTSLPNSNLTTTNTITNTIHGGGVEGGANVELFKNFHAIATAFWSSGGGRYIASTGGPDVVVRPDGTLAGVKSGSFIGGFEWQATPKTLFYGYGSGAYFGKAVYAQVLTGQKTTGTGATGTCTITNFVGYGNGPGTAVLDPGSTGTCPAATAATSSANRMLYEPTIGVVQTLWRNPAYGDLKIITQYSYVSREPWYTTAPASASILPSAHNSMVYIDLRYDLP